MVSPVHTKFLHSGRTTDPTHKKNIRWKWTDDEARAFRELKTTLTSAPVLACPDFSRRFFLQTDASTTGLGAVLTQNYEDGERVIAYASRTLNTAERNYSATELECLAIVWGIRRMKSYLEGYAFTVITDHQALKWLQRLESPTGRLGRWVFELQQYDFDIKYRRGVLNRVADALSRYPTTCAARKPECQWYRRIYEEVRTDPASHPDYRIAEGKLYRHILHSLNFKDTAADEQWRLCIPKGARGDILKQYHDAPTAGHLGIAKTIARIAERNYWPGMFRDIAKYVRMCRNCQTHKVAQQRPAGTLHATNITRPWEQVTIDLVGPLPRSRQGHTWLFVLQDRFTKWVELVPLRRATADAVTKALTERIILRHGRPNSVLSDNGTQLRSTQLDARLQALQIRHITAPVYAPHCNPVERTNRTIKTMITQYVEKDHRTWDEHILALQFAYNTATHDATGYTPAYLNHGRELRAPEETDQPDATTDTPDVIRQKLIEAYELVKVQLAQAFHRQKKYYDLRRRAWKPSVGEWVWKRDHPLSKKSQAFNAKLAPKYSGPYEVRRSISPVIVDLRSKRGKWIRHIHIQDLKPADNNTANENGDLLCPGDNNIDNEPEISAITGTDRIEMANREDILEEISALLAEYEAAQPPPPQNAAPTASTSAAPPKPPPARPPRVGTLVQRSDHVNRRKREALLAPPPPPPKPRQPRPYERPPPPARPTDTPPTPRPVLLQPMGPLPSPPIPVEVEPGIVVEIPHFAVHVSRRYKPRTSQGRWIVRFTRDGKVRYVRRLA